MKTCFGVRENMVLMKYVSILIIILSAYLALFFLAGLARADISATSSIVVEYSDSGKTAAYSTNTVSLASGTEISYVVKYSNLSVSNAVLKLILPSEVKYVNSTPALSSDSENVFTYHLGNLNKNDNGLVTLEAIVYRPEVSGENLVITSILEDGNVDSFDNDIAHTYTTIKIDSPSSVYFGTLSSVFSMPTSYSLILRILATLIVLLAAFYIFYLYSSADRAGSVKYPSAVIPKVPDDNTETAVLGFSFGQRGSEPGLSNESMAKVIKNFYSNDLISVQWEIGHALKTLGVNPIQEISENLTKKGAYLDTEEVARQMSDFLTKQDKPLNIRVVAHDDHIERVLKTLKKFGIEGTQGCLNIPYDPESSQIWTRSPLLFKVRETLAWPLYLLRGLS